MAARLLHFESNLYVDISVLFSRMAQGLLGRSWWTQTEEVLKSNYAAARGHLERAYDHLPGDDETSLKARHALDLLIEAVAIAQHRPKPAQIVRFPSRREINH